MEEKSFLVFASQEKMCFLLRSIEEILTISIITKFTLGM